MAEKVIDSVDVEPLDNPNDPAIEAEGNLVFIYYGHPDEDPAEPTQTVLSNRLGGTVKKNAEGLLFPTVSPPSPVEASSCVRRMSS
jgi:hypothetical protein